jgi:hypothetical protein
MEDQPEAIDGWTPELSEMKEFTHGGRTYAGRLYREFDDEVERLEKQLSTTSSLENHHSIWLTEDSLVQLLRDVGFEQVEKLLYGARSDDWWADPRRDSCLLIRAVKSRKPFQSRIFGR